eukprot:1708307-Amphidinium_carterae.1
MSPRMALHICGTYIEIGTLGSPALELATKNGHDQQRFNGRDPKSAFNRHTHELMNGREYFCGNCIPHMCNFSAESEAHNNQKEFSNSAKGKITFDLRGLDLGDGKGKEGGRGLQTNVVQRNYSFQYSRRKHF